MAQHTAKQMIPAVGHTVFVFVEDWVIPMKVQLLCQ
jgi:hypothetical protein